MQLKLSRISSFEIPPEKPTNLRVSGQFSNFE
jgi:hypothetical protein